MRVLFSTTAGAGHFGPMIPIAQACLAAGHEVAVAAPAGFAAHVTNAGLAHLPFPDVPADQMGAVFGRLPALPREEANRIVVAEVFGRLDAQAALPTLIDITRDWRPDVVVRDPCEFASLVTAVGSGIPQVQVAIGLGQFLPSVADALDEPLRELEQLAGLDDIQGADRVLATPTFTSVPAELDDLPGDRGRSGDDGSRVWRFRSEVGRVGSIAAGGMGRPHRSAGLRQLRVGHRLRRAFRCRVPGRGRGSGRPAGAGPADHRIRLRPGPPRPVAGQRLGDALVAAGGGDARDGRGHRPRRLRHDHDGAGRRRTPAGRSRSSPPTSS